MQPTIIFEDESLLVLNKPSGMTVNKADTTKNEETVQEWVQSRVKGKALSVKENNFTLTPSPLPLEYDPVQEFYSRGGIVHRLDKETSGILLVAKNPDTFQKLKQQFMERTVKKTYLALAHGKIQPEEGEIAVPLGRLEFNRKRFGVVAGGREARTLYRVISTYVFARSEATRQSHGGDRHAFQARDDEALSLVELSPQTGRTHQIRVHLKHINHPIFADELYAGRKTSRQDRRFLPRFFLHASKISFVHPTTEKEVIYEAPLPEELREFLNQLKIIQ